MALLFLLLATWERRRSPLRSRLGYGVAGVFVLAALEYPGMSVQAVVEDTASELAWLVNAARGLGLALVMVALVTELRGALQRD